ncbi:hypothetical protein Scep_007992 [Stephania cephalantha]|uniref:NPH3 domain-containing protein n=1 Tax=Stephania cephalantha TaxID=152367 RepID=A0AAP0KDK8_9MAGN
MAAKSGKLASFLQSSHKEQTPMSYSLTDVPGDAAIFEQVRRFCYGLDVKFSATNVVPLICAAHYLEMNEQYSHDNLLDKCVTFFQVNVLPQWNECVKALISTTEHSVLEQAIHLGLVEACVNSLVTKAQISPHLLGEPIDPNPDRVEDDEFDDDDRYMPNAKRRLFSHGLESEDLVLLRLKLYAPIMACMIKAGVQSEYVAGSLLRYVNKYIDLGSFEGDQSDDDHRIREKSFQRDVVEALEKLLPDEIGIFPCKLFSAMLQSAIALQASSKCRHGLETRLGRQLDEANVEDLLIRSYGYSKEQRYDIECVAGIMKAFYSDCTSPLNHTKMLNVTELVEEFLVRVASDEELSKEKFIALAKTLQEISNGTNRSLDGIYHAIDIYLDTHRNLTETEREDVCQVLDCYKMSPEACTHAAQNKRLPLRVVVQALFVGQLHLREAIVDRIEGSDYESQKGNELVVDEDHSSEMRIEMERMDERVINLENECSKMKGQIIEKGKDNGRFKVWKQLKRKLGCISSSAHEYDCHIKKKVHPRN